MIEVRGLWNRLDRGWKENGERIDRGWIEGMIDKDFAMYWIGGID